MTSNFVMYYFYLARTEYDIFTQKISVYINRLLSISCSFQKLCIMTLSANSFLGNTCIASRFKSKFGKKYALRILTLELSSTAAKIENRNLSKATHF